MNVQLQDAIWEETQGYLAVPSISKDGKRAYFVYQINVDGVTTKAAELFAIESGKFVSLARFTVGASDPFLSVLSGFANEDFTEFTLLSTNLEDGLAGLYRLSVLRYDGTADLQVVKSVEKSAYVTGYTPNGANYVGNHIVVTAVIENVSDQGSARFRGGSLNTPLENVSETQISAMWLFDRQLNVKQIHSFQEVFTTPNYSFVHNDQNYFAIASAGGKLDYIDPAASWQPPFQLRVFGLVEGRIYDVASALLPQGSLGCNVYVSPGETLISVGTFTALRPQEVTIVKSTEFNISATPDERELRVYRFNCETLTLQKAEDTDATVDSVFINETLFIRSINTGPYAEGDPSFFNIYSRCGAGKLYVQPINNTPVFAASANGKVLIAGSASRPEYNNNLLLFYVSN